MLSLAGGTISYGVYFLIKKSNTRSILAELTLFFAVTLVQAATLGLLLNRATINEQSLQTQLLVSQALDQVLMPLRPLVYDDAQEDYSWRCLVAPAEAGDPNPEYVRLIVEVTKTVHQLPRELRAVCIAALDESALAEYMNDERYVLRWIQRPQLDPTDRAIFNVDCASIDGVQLAVDWTTVGSKGSEWRASIPRAMRLDDGAHVLFFRYLVRKRLGTDKRGTIRTQLFQTTFGSSFSCTVDSQIGLSSLAVYHTEISPLSRKAVPTGRFNDSGNGPWHVGVHYTAPLQRGSAISFELERS